MYEEILYNLNVGDQFRYQGEVYTIIAKPFGKWIDAKSADRAHKFKSSARVEVVSQVPQEQEEVNEGIDYDW